MANTVANEASSEGLSLDGNNSLGYTTGFFHLDG
ncbi:MAG: hypothetical protein JWL59_1569 [Chthoniobacteraceae bacterium]|nr:hypothetical protein [Chthoniobacteraceae bacterium]